MTNIVPRFLSDPGSSFFLFGPRGTGKSTWVRQAFPAALVLDLLEPDVYRSLVARPERLVERIEAEPRDRTVVIDEIQKLPALLDVVHLLIERRGTRFVLTGSSARKLKRSGVDRLAGRALRRELYPFMAAELGSRFRLDHALANGMIPVVWSAAKPAETLAAYVGLYVREEVQAEGLTRDIGGFSRFLEAVSFSHAAPLNVSNVARDAEVQRKTVEGYLSILEDLLLAFRIPVFTRRASRGLTQHPKLFFADAGVYRALRPAGPLDRPTEIEGPGLEGLVAQHLRAWIGYRQSGDTLHFWRTPSGTEVDFVVHGPSGLFAIEVKNAGRVRDQDLRSLAAFRSDYPEAKAMLLYRGREPSVRDGISIRPVEDFLAELTPSATRIA